MTTTANNMDRRETVVSIHYRPDHDAEHPWLSRQLRFRP